MSPWTATELAAIMAPKYKRMNFKTIDALRGRTLKAIAIKRSRLRRDTPWELCARFVVDGHDWHKSSSWCNDARTD